jgi:hypothetical protein
VRTPTPLEEHLAYLESIGSKPCTCRHEWKKSRDYMAGWVRMNTEPDCLEHGTEAGPVTAPGPQPAPVSPDLECTVCQHVSSPHGVPVSDATPGQAPDGRLLSDYLRERGRPWAADMIEAAERAAAPAVTAATVEQAALAKIAYEAYAEKSCELHGGDIAGWSPWEHLTEDGAAAWQAAVDAVRKAIADGAL